MKKTKQHPLEKYLWNRIIDYLHTDSTEFAQRLLIASRSLGTRLTEHTAKCRRCRRAIDSVVEQGPDGCLESPR